MLIIYFLLSLNYSFADVPQCTGWPEKDDTLYCSSCGNWSNRPDPCHSIFINGANVPVRLLKQNLKTKELEIDKTKVDAEAAAYQAFIKKSLDDANEAAALKEKIDSGAATMNEKVDYILKKVK